MKYRPDIDGLRAAAVLSVVFFHFNFSFAPGGFIGVDVFFVISGYLITKLISAEMDAGTYSTTKFYVRRARRIFPALFFMLAVCSLYVVSVYLPNEITNFNSSVAAATLFFSNIHCYLNDIEQLPLLKHTWSLSVEEQFYIGFPLILLAIRRYLPNHVTKILMGLTLLSFAISCYLIFIHNKPAAFYLLQSRAWELLVGALLAVGAFSEIRKRATAEALGVIGLISIAAGVHSYHLHDVPFPGFMALIPGIGAALVIHSGEKWPTITSRLLAIKPVRFIGLISFSLYLWHWPIEIAALYWWDPLTRMQKLGMMALSFAAAVFSWYFVEEPFRRKPYRFGSVATLSTSAAAMAMLLVVSVLIYPLSVRLWNMPEEAQRMLSVLDSSEASMQNGSCFLNANLADFGRFDQKRCLPISSDKKNYLLIGDNHAASLWAGLAQVDPEINFLEATAHGCKPIIGAKAWRYCTDLVKFVVGDFLLKHHVDTILITARWAPEDIEGIKKTATALTAYADRVVVLGPTVEYRHSLPRMLAMSILRNDPSLVERDRLTEQKQTDKLFAEAFRDTKIQYFSVYDALCPQDHCQLTDGNHLPLQFDGGDFTLSGSIYVAQLARKAGALNYQHTNPSELPPSP
ncbi:MAG: acyltransferase [Gammaproteobacteria bacterium]|nr:acyltransferase [Gammaproteobacteria bacterium]